ncbi:hypothetical protein SDC9_114156 [bioreactor metagenome]|uniref:Uncharacterized protein n=1 Tax=bioreactor metagenome TaxID=1076179 RepID=A0A645BPM7_9ZZZZ
MQQRKVNGVDGGGGDALLLQGPQNAANARVGILHVINGVVAVLAHGKVKVKQNLRAGFALVKHKARAVHRHIVQQVHQRDGLAGALAHAHLLPVFHQFHQLHQHDVQPAAGQAHRVHRAAHTGHMARVVGAPNVDGKVKPAGDQLIIMVGNVGGKIGGDAVGTHQHFVFGAVLRFIVAGLGVFVGAPFQAVFARPVPDGTVLFVGGTKGGQLIQHFLHRAAAMQLAFAEPHVVVDAVFFHRGFHRGDIQWQCKVDQCLLAFGFVLFDKAVAKLAGKLGSALFDVLALISLFGERHGIFAQKQLQIAGRKAVAKFFDLVARVVDVKLTRDIIARPVQRSGKAVAQRATARIAKVHRAGGVGRNKFHIDPLALAKGGAAPRVALLQCGTHGVGKIIVF